MGGALARGWIRAIENKGQLLINSEADICVTARTEQTLERYAQEFHDIRTSSSNADAVRGADVIVLAVKPWLLQGVIEEIRPYIDFSKQTVCSVAAGVGTEKLDEMFVGSGHFTNHNFQLFYVMPNIAAEFGESMTFIAPYKSASAEATQQVKQLFGLLGDVHLCDEKMMPAGMMMAGCGIAYVMRFLRAQMEAGVEMGFPPQEALQIAMQTMNGATAFLKETGLHPEAAIDRVTTPGGTTIKGLNTLDHAGFNSAVIRCLKAGL